MKQRTKEVYYCDHCNKHGLVKNAMERHILSCRKNPDNFHPCFTCKHFKQAKSEWWCASKDITLQSRSAHLRNCQKPYASTAIMPKDCDKYEFQGFKDENGVIEDPKFTDQYKQFMEGLGI